VSSEAGSPAPVSDPRPRKSGIVSRGAAIIAWMSLLFGIVAWIAVRFGDAWAPATFLMFGPRWVLPIAPACALFLTVIFRRRSIPVALVALILAGGPAMGFVFPIPGAESDPAAMRVLTCNLHNARIDGAAIAKFTQDANADVAAFQESYSDRQFASFSTPKWHAHRAAGLVLISRYPIRRAEVLGTDSMSERGLVATYELETPRGLLTVFNLHFATPRDALANVVSGQPGGWKEIEENSATRRAQSENVAAAAGKIRGAVLILGDFNTPTESVVFKKAWSNFEDAFATAGWGWGYTFRIKRTAVRIDHILMRNGQAIHCWVGPDIGSPHRPVLADVRWPTE
jgi:endonuclease/exonuclease/phosphatase family metal-dependent hydrolase